jgi:hypothetical protein
MRHFAAGLPLTFLCEQRLIQTVEETDLGTPRPIALSFVAFQDLSRH